ncbi:MAG: hypothetical protein CMM01_20095 [Rhodopirellula sp.]|nr:hypothetical protein [Rhodopirellula sp.]
MLSRVAESIYWMSRQVERAENTARFLEVTHNLTLDQPEDQIDHWVPLIEASGDKALFEAKHKTANSETVTQFLAFDSSYSNSMLSSLRQARTNARGVRESLSSETFEQLNDFYRFVADAAKAQPLDSPNDFFDAVRRIALQWTGVLDSTMSHDIGWQFANAGRLIERADKTSRVLDVKYFNLLPRLDDVGTAVDDLQWSALLSAISGFEAYRREHHLVDIEKVVGFFLFKRSFPRSILYSITGAAASLREISDMSKASSHGKATQVIVKLQHRLQETSVKEVLAGGMHHFVDVLQTELNQIGEALNQDYFHSAT